MRGITRQLTIHKRIHTMKSPIAFAALMTASMYVATASVVVLTSCERKPKTIGEKIDDALDTRPHEKLKDAGEDLKDAAKDAKESVKDAVK
jgi:hypothetical protein